MTLQIPSEDRIQNIKPLPEGFDSTDPTLLNADWVMKIFDNLVNGNYNTKPFTMYETVADLPTADVELGQAAYVASEPSSFFLYNGTTWANIAEQKPLIAADLYTFDGITGTALNTALELGDAIMVYRNGLLQTVTDDYTYTVGGATITFVDSLGYADKVSVVTATTGAKPIPTVNNSTISFTVDGITQGSFTTNRATNATIALNVAPQTQNIADSSVSLACVKNTNYFMGTISGLTITSIEVSPLETKLYFTTDSSSFSFANTSGMSQWLGSVPTFATGKKYVLNICNGIGAVAEIVTE